MRTFETGATRDSDQDKYDYEGFLSPAVLERFAAYMHHHRRQADGNLRDSDNWQKGIPQDQYMKSMWRHFMNLWKRHRRLTAEESVEEALCALLFNVQGYLHEVLKKERTLMVPQRLQADFPREDPVPFDQPKTTIREALLDLEAYPHRRLADRVKGDPGLTEGLNYHPGTCITCGFEIGHAGWCEGVEG